MMSLTHAVIAATGASLILGSADPIVLGIAAAGSQLPDIDSTETYIGRILYPIAHYLEEKLPHRSLTHSILFTVAIAVVSLPLWYFVDWKHWAALWLGHFLACYSDTFTRQGVQLFYPSPLWVVNGMNPNMRLVTGSLTEYWVFGIFIALLIVVTNTQAAGGIMQAVDRGFGLADGVTNLLNEKGSKHYIYTHIEGSMASDRTPVNKRFLVLGETGKQFVVADDSGIYKTGEGILAQKFKGEVGEPASNKIITTRFVEEEFNIQISNILSAYPESLLIVSGEIKVDNPEDIMIQLEPGKHQTARLTGNALTFDYCPIEKAAQLLTGQFGSGQITIKISYPRPRI